MANRPSRLAVAIHEAGHAIAQLSTGPAPWIDYISIGGDDPDQLGLVHTEAMWQPGEMLHTAAPPEVIEQWRALADRDVVNFLAGPIAELRWRHSRAAIWLGARQMAERCLGEPTPAEHTDFGRVRRRLCWAHPGREREAFNEAWLATEELVATWWREIVQLGRELARKERIENKELRAMWAELRERRRPGVGGGGAVH